MTIYSSKVNILYTMHWIL